MLRCISNGATFNIRIRSRTINRLLFQRLINTSDIYNQARANPRPSVDEFLSNDSTFKVNELHNSNKTNLVPLDVFIREFNSSTTIKQIENHIEQATQKKDFKKVWRIANLTKEFKIIPSNWLYIQLLRACYLIGKPEATSLAIRLYLEALGLTENDQPLTKDNHQRLAYFLLASYSNCNDFTELITLKMLWENYIIQHVDKSIFELLYHSAYINTLLNTNQNQIALEHFEKVYHELTKPCESGIHHQYDSYEILLALPTIRILDIMSSNNEIQRLQNWLEIINREQELELGIKSKDYRRIIEGSKWLRYLNAGLINNNYGLVKCIYDNYIMKGFSGGISTEDILFRKDPTLTGSNSGNIIMNSINDETIFQILHTFAINGDVNSTLSFIESHYIHKQMKGEKALTKELCLKIIEAYCYHPDLQSNWTEDEISNISINTDESIYRVLDVLNGFVTKFEINDNPISYKDISEPMSFKFVNYKVYDANIDKEKRKRFKISEKIKNPEDIEKSPGLPRKMSNINIENSSHGNVFANLEILSNFITVHLAYLRDEKKYSNATITLFVNCILNHTNLYQNFSGTVRALSAIHRSNPQMVQEWLNTESFDIILNSLANSNSAKISSLLLFKFLSGSKITHDNYRCFISANLRGDFHQSLQFFLYHYLIDYKGVIDPKIRQMLQELPIEIVQADPGTQYLFSFIMKIDRIHPKLIDRGLIQQEEIDHLWQSQKLCLENPYITDEDVHEFKRLYNHSIDIRDSNYLEYIFKIPYTCSE